VKNIRGHICLPRLDRCHSSLFTSKVHFFLSFKKAREKRKESEEEKKGKGLISSYKASRERGLEAYTRIKTWQRQNGSVSNTHTHTHTGPYNLKLKLSRVYRLYFTPCYFFLFFLSFLHHSNFTASVTCQLNMHLTVSGPA